MVKQVRIRVSKEDSATVYFLVESYEGIATVSTLPHQPGDRHRDLQFWVPDAQRQEFDRLMARLHDELPDGMKEIEES